MNKGTKGNNQNVKETKANLKDQLLTIGLNNEDSFKRAKTAYNSMYSAKRVKADLDKWHQIGSFFFDAREAMEGKKNMNSGHLSKIRTTYFPELTAQDQSNAIWLAKNFPHVKEWIQQNKRSLSNPASILQAIRKDLKSKEYANEVEKGDAFNHFGLKPPKESKPKPPEPKDKKRNNTTLADNLKHLEQIITQLEKISSKQWTLEQFKKFEILGNRLGDFSADIEGKLKKNKINKVNDNVAKKKAA